MKLKITMLVLLVCFGQIMTVNGQTDPESFVVKFITIDGDSVPRFVWRYSNTIISWSRESNTDEVSCLKRELLKTGLFSEVEPELYKLKESDGYELSLTIKYNSPNPVYTVSEIKLSGFNEVNES